MKILVTGAAGFIGFHVVKGLLNHGNSVVGIDNINSYYDVQLKYARLKETGIEKSAITEGKYVQSIYSDMYRFVKMDLNDGESLNRLFESENFTHIIHLAAQAGVRYSIKNPFAYIDSNISGFLSLLEICRLHQIKHLVYASSSSVYGKHNNSPFKETDVTDNPVSLYAATKKANELMAYTYASMYKLPATGLRFFTVYGPWGRPDMAPSLFMTAILKGETIELFNRGEMERDFTYIDDIVNGILKVIPSAPLLEIPHVVYNMGCSSPVKLINFVKVIENVTGKTANLKLVDMQPGDVTCTYADTSCIERNFNYKPSTTIQEGISSYFRWFVKFYQPTYSL